MPPTRPTPPPPDLAERIRVDNLRMHDAPGYAEFYDRYVGLVCNPWEQRRFDADLRRIAARLPRGFTALDLGCGTGNLTLRLLNLGADVTAVDLSAAMLDRLRSKATAARLRTVHADADAFLAADARCYDLVCACSFLHHVPDYLATAAAAARRVAPGGCLYFVHEPLPRGECNLAGRVLESIDFALQRAAMRLRLGRRWPRNDPYYDPAGLADYWAISGGIDSAALSAAVRREGLAPRIERYDSKRHCVLHRLAAAAGSRHLLMLEAWRV